MIVSLEHRYQQFFQDGIMTVNEYKYNNALRL